MKKIFAISVVSAVLLFVTSAYAGWCNGYGQGNRGGGKGFNCPVYGGNNINDADYKKLNSLKQKFYNDTKDLREKLYNKSSELRSAFNAKNPNKSKVLSLQKEISDLRGKLSEKAVSFRLEAKKINPDFGSGYGRGHRGGWGRGGGRGCW